MQRDLIHIHKYLQGGCNEDRDMLSSVVPSVGTTGNGHKLEHKRFLITSGSIYVLAGAGALAQVVQKVSRISSLKIFMRHLDVVLGTQLWMSLLVQRLGQMDPEVLANLNL